jgi:MSHA biogenesis protein MshO
MRGVTLIEMVIAMVILAIVVVLTMFLANPLREAVDATTRAELTDIADNALQRIGRDVRLALPNSVRVDGTARAVELIPVQTAGRYRVEPAGACVGASDDQLAFGAPDSCFKSIGQILDAGSVTTADQLVLNNYGEGFPSQNAYAGANRAQIAGAIVSQQVVTFASTTFDRGLHDSPGRRFYIVGAPVSYVCDLAQGTITRYAGYGFNATQLTSFKSGTAAAIASNVVGCSFDYSPDVAPMVGLLTLSLTLRKPTTTGAETVTLYHSVHVNNVP